MQNLQTSLFYDLQELIRASSLLRKYYLIFKALDPSALKDKNTGKCYGCTKYLDVTDDARSRVPRDSKKFKETFKIRQTVEQYFARLGDREVEQTTHYKSVAIKNQMTIAHLAATGVAVAAGVLLKQPDKIRCYRTFAKAG